MSKSRHIRRREAQARLARKSARIAAASLACDASARLDVVKDNLSHAQRPNRLLPLSSAHHHGLLARTHTPTFAHRDWDATRKMADPARMTRARNAVAHVAAMLARS